MAAAVIGTGVEIHNFLSNTGTATAEASKSRVDKLMNQLAEDPDFSFGDAILEANKINDSIEKSSFVKSIVLATERTQTVVTEEVLIIKVGPTVEPRSTSEALIRFSIKAGEKCISGGCESY